MAAFAGRPLAYGGARAARASVSVRAEKAVTSNKIGCAQPSLAGPQASGSSEARPPLCFALTAAWRSPLAEDQRVSGADKSLTRITYKIFRTFRIDGFFIHEGATDE